MAAHTNRSNVCTAGTPGPSSSASSQRTSITFVAPPSSSISSSAFARALASMARISRSRSSWRKPVGPVEAPATASGSTTRTRRDGLMPVARFASQNRAAARTKSRPPQGTTRMKLLERVQKPNWPSPFTTLPAGSNTSCPDFRAEQPRYSSQPAQKAWSWNPSHSTTASEAPGVLIAGRPGFGCARKPRPCRPSDSTQARRPGASNGRGSASPGRLALPRRAVCR